MECAGPMDKERAFGPALAGERNIFRHSIKSGEEQFRSSAVVSRWIGTDTAAAVRRGSEGNAAGWQRHMGRIVR
jgi:hypothetical protein